MKHYQPTRLNTIFGISSKFGPLNIFLVLLFFFFVKLFLVNSQTLHVVSGGRYDDFLFLDLARNILSGNWLGEYNNLTLAKGCFYPIWIAISFTLGLPLLMSEQILYAGACLLFVYAVRPIMKNNWYSIISYMVLLFNPASFADGPMTRVIREGIYSSLTIIAISCAIGLVLRRNAAHKTLRLWSIMLGLSLSAFWLTREEGLWLMPFIFILLGYSLIMDLRMFRKNTASLFSRRVLLIYVLPFVIWGALLLTVAVVNDHKYRSFATVEFRSKAFLDAYGSLTRVKHRDWDPQIPIPTETRMRIYKVSPAFAELKPYLEGHSSAWFKYTPAPERGEIYGGWFMWALRDAVAAAGYYTDGAAAENYYKRLAHEVDLACDTGRLEAFSGKRSTMIPPWHKEYLKPLLLNMLISSDFVLRFKNISATTAHEVCSAEQLAFFRYFTHEDTSPQRSIKSYRITILTLITGIYSLIMPILFVISLGIFIKMLVLLRNNRNDLDIIMIMTGLIAVFITRIALLSFIHMSSFSAINPQYLSPCHAILILFILLSASKCFRATI